MYVHPYTSRAPPEEQAALHRALRAAAADADDA